MGDDTILEDLRDADRRGVNPPQNWTTRAADEIERLRKEITKRNARDLERSMSKVIDKNFGKITLDD